MKEIYIRYQITTTYHFLPGVSRVVTSIGSSHF